MKSAGEGIDKSICNSDSVIQYLRVYTTRQGVNEQRKLCVNRQGSYYIHLQGVISEQ